MADKINIEIDLEGGAEVEKQLADIGKAGQQAFGDIQNAADQIDLSSATDALNNVQTAVQGAATIEKIVQNIGKVQGAFDALGNAATKMATRLTRSLGVLGVFARALGPVGITLGVAGGAFIKFGDDAADALNGLTVAAAKLGQTPQQLDVLQKALTQFGAAPDAITSGLQKLQASLAGEFFPVSLTQGLQNIISQLERMPDSVERTQLAIQTLGEGLGGAVIAGLQTGTLSAQNFAQALAGITPVTQQQIVEAAKYQIALNQLSAAWTNLKAAITPITTPIFQFLTEQVNIFIQNLKQLRLEIALIKGVWDVFKAGISGQDVGEAARKAAQEYKKLEEQLKQTGTAGTKDIAAMGQAAAQSNQQMIRGADGVVRAEESVAQSWERRKAEQQAAVAAQDAAIAQEHAQMQRAVAARENARAAAQRAADEARRAQEAAYSAAVAQQTAAIQAAGGWQSLAEEVYRTNRALAALIETAGRAAEFVQGLSRPTTVPFQRPGALAGGGFIGGRGTGTSDSNLAWVSRGEHIMPARAVRQPGVLAFLETLRRSDGNLRGILDGMGRFALGGLVPRPAMAFAGGGPVGGMNHVTIQFPGLPPVGGLRASSAVVEELQRSAALAQVRSGGRKPSRYS